MYIIKIESYKCLLQYRTSSLLSTVSVIWQVIITIITPEQPPSISSNESHGWFVTVTSPYEHHEHQREVEDVSLWCCQVHLNPIRLGHPSPRASSPTFTNFIPQLCLALSWQHQINVFKIIKLQLNYFPQPQLLFSFHLKGHAHNCSKWSVFIIFFLLSTFELYKKKILF